MNAGTPIQAQRHSTSGCLAEKAETFSDQALDANVEAVVRKQRERAKFGLGKYRVTTERDDLTTLEWLKHAQEEAMDLAVYLERCIKDLRAVADQNGTDGKPGTDGTGVEWLVWQGAHGCVVRAARVAREGDALFFMSGAGEVVASFPAACTGYTKQEARA